VLPYQPYRDSAVLRLAAAADKVAPEMLLAAQDSTNELVRVRHTLKHLRSFTYEFLDMVGAFGLWTGTRCCCMVGVYFELS
jgi:hypothetical protein